MALACTYLPTGCRRAVVRVVIADPLIDVAERHLLRRRAVDGGRDEVRVAVRRLPGQRRRLLMLQINLARIVDLAADLILASSSSDATDSAVVRISQQATIARRPVAGSSVTFHRPAAWVDKSADVETSEPVHLGEAVLENVRHLCCTGRLTSRRRSRPLRSRITRSLFPFDARISPPNARRRAIHRTCQSLKCVRRRFESNRIEFLRKTMSADVRSRILRPPSTAVQLSIPQHPFDVDARGVEESITQVNHRSVAKNLRVRTETLPPPRRRSAIKTAASRDPLVDRRQWMAVTPLPALEHCDSIGTEARRAPRRPVGKIPVQTCLRPPRRRGCCDCSLHRRHSSSSSCCCCNRTTGRANGSSRIGPPTSAGGRPTCVRTVYSARRAAAVNKICTVCG